MQSALVVILWLSFKQETIFLWRDGISCLNEWMNHERQQGFQWKEINTERSQRCWTRNRQWGADFFAHQSKTEGCGFLVLLEESTSHQSFPLIMPPAVRGPAAAEQRDILLRETQRMWHLRNVPSELRCQPRSSFPFTKSGLVCREHSGTLHLLKCNLGSWAWWCCR